MGASQKRAGHGGDVQPAYRRQHVQHVPAVNRPPGHGLTQHRLLPGEALVRQSAAPARHRVDVRPGEHRQHGGGGGGVADAHLADAQGRHAVPFGPRGLLYARRQRVQHLPAGHGVLTGDVAGGAADVPV